jgi:uncharacterized protein
MSRLRVTLTAVASLGLVGLLAAPASAHVSVSSDNAQQGGEGKVVFQVPDESDNATTTKVQVAFPTDTPFASVDVQPKAGWTFQTTTSKLPQPITTDDGDQVTEAVSTVTWTAANGGGIKPGEFDEFAVSVGPLPNANSVVFKALQTYSDGSVVRWIDTPAPGGAEPEHPAPTLTLLPAGATNATAAAPASPAPAAQTSSNQKNSSNTLSIIALVLGALGLLAGIGALALARRTRQTLGSTSPAAAGSGADRNRSSVG